MKAMQNAGAVALLIIAVGAGSAALPAQAAASSSAIAAYSIAAPISTAPSGLVARAIVAAGVDCPTLDVTSVGGAARSITMRERPRPDRTSPAFDSLTVCSSVMPRGSVSASIEGRPIPARMPARTTRLALMGDSGCRITAWEVQDCADPDEWPLARIATEIAKERPDAIIMNGDYFYREAPCPAADQALCGSSPSPVTGMPFTDSAYGWLADVFVPMAPMLSVAPLIAIRGNHEACYRGGNGYFYFLDPREGTSNACAPVDVNGTLTAAPTLPSDTYAIDLPVAAGRTLRLAVVDSAGGNDSAVDAYAAILRPAYAKAAALTTPRTGRESWLVTHRPIFGILPTVFATPGQPFSQWSSYDQGAAAYGLLDSYDMIFSSHQHLAQAVQLPGLPGQLILGNAGTELYPTIGYSLPTTAYTVGEGKTYPMPSWAWVDVKFGYAMATPNETAGSWRLDMKAADGSRFARCGVRDRSLYCASTP